MLMAAAQKQPYKNAYNMIERDELRSSLNGQRGRGTSRRRWCDSLVKFTGIKLQQSEAADKKAERRFGMNKGRPLSSSRIIICHKDYCEFNSDVELEVQAEKELTPDRYVTPIRWRGYLSGTRRN